MKTIHSSHVRDNIHLLLALSPTFAAASLTGAQVVVVLGEARNLIDQSRVQCPNGGYFHTLRSLYNLDEAEIPIMEAVLNLLLERTRFRSTMSVRLKETLQVICSLITEADLALPWREVFQRVCILLEERKIATKKEKPVVELEDDAEEDLA